MVQTWLLWLVQELSDLLPSSSYLTRPVPRPPCEPRRHALPTLSAPCDACRVSPACPALGPPTCPLPYEPRKCRLKNVPNALLSIQ